MKIFEYRMYGTELQYSAIDDAIRTVQFIRNSVIARWIFEGSKPKEQRRYGKTEMSADCAVLAKTYAFCGRLNSQARQASAERGWSSVKRYYENCKNQSIKNKGYPKFKKDVRSVEYKVTGWKFCAGTKQITFTDKTGMGTFTLRGGRYLSKERVEKIQRVRIVRRADKYYLQVCVDLENKREQLPKTGKAVGLDLGLKEFYVDSTGFSKENPRFLRKAEKKLKKMQRQLSRCKKGSKNRRKRKFKLAKLHIRVANQRKDFCGKAAKDVVTSNDVVVLEKLNIRKMVRSRLAKSISDVSWGAFRTQLENYSKLYSRTILYVNPADTTQACNACGCLPTKKITLNVRTYKCEHCGLILDRDLNAAINILQSAYSELATAGHAESGSIHQCIKDALVESKKLNVFGDQTSVFGIQIPKISQIDEKETINLTTKKSLEAQLKSLGSVD